MHPCVHAWTAVAFYYTRVEEEVSDEQRRVVTINNCAIGAQSNALGDAHWIIFRIISNGESFADTRQNFQANNGRLRKAISRLIAIETYTYLSSSLASPPPLSLPSSPLSPTVEADVPVEANNFFPTSIFWISQPWKLRTEIREKELPYSQRIIAKLNLNLHSLESAIYFSIPRRVYLLIFVARV